MPQVILHWVIPYQVQTMFPAIRYTGRYASDPLGQMTLPEETIFAGAGSQTGLERWGDYTSMNVDPNGVNFWYVNQYQPSNGSFNWRTRIANINVTTTFQLTVNIFDGWNMVTIPGLHPVDQNVNTWWQYRDMSVNVFKYSSGYQVVTTGVPAEGYYMKHSGARTYNTGDEWPTGGIQIVPHNPINANAGWNMFGGYETNVATSGLITIPPGLISGPIYGYSGGYYVATNLVPGYGYWAKLTGAGQIIIPNAMLKGDGELVEWFKDDWGRIIIRLY